MNLDASSLLDVAVLRAIVLSVLGTCNVVALASTLAGSGTAFWADGVGTASCFSYPRGISASSDGVVFVADGDNNRIRMVSTSGEGSLVEALRITICCCKNASLNLL